MIATRYVCQHRIDHRPYSERTEKLTPGGFVGFLMVFGWLIAFLIACIVQCGCQQVAKTKIDPATSEARRVDSKVTMRFGVPPKPEPPPPQKVKIYVITPAPTCPAPAQPVTAPDHGSVDGSGAADGRAVPGG